MASRFSWVQKGTKAKITSGMYAGRYGEVVSNPNSDFLDDTDVVMMDIQGITNIKAVYVARLEPIKTNGFIE